MTGFLRLATAVCGAWLALQGGAPSWGQASPQDELAAAAKADESGRYEEAVRHYEKFLSTQAALPLSPAVIEARTRLADADFFLHRYRESLEALKPLPFDLVEDATPDRVASSKGSAPKQAGASAIPVHAWLVRGLDYLDLNQLPDAIKCLHQTLVLDPDSGTARLALGDALARSGRPEEAADAYREQLRRTPGVAEAWYKLGVVYTDLAQKVSTDFARERSDSALPVLLAAEQLEDRGDYWGAAQALLPIVHSSQPSPATSSGPANPSADNPHSTIPQQSFQPGLHADLGAALLYLGYPRAAGREFGAELSQDPESLPALLGTVEIEALGSRWDEALEAFQRLMNLYPGELPLRLESPPPAPLSEAWKQGRVALPPRLADLPAGKLLSLWLGSDGLGWPARLDPAETKCSPPPANQRLNPGRWIAEVCAAQWSEELNSKTGLNENQTARLIELDYHLGRYEESRERARILLRSAPNDAWAQYWLTKSYSALAGQCFAKLAELSPDSARVHEMLARSDADQNRLSAAGHEYEVALHLAPELPDLHLGLGTVYWLAGDWTRAEDELKKTLELSPGSAVASYELGDSYTQQHQWQQAVGPLKRALTNSAVESRARLDLAKTEEELGQPSAAIEDLLLLAPGDRNGEVHYRLAMLYRKIGENTEAQAELATSEALRKSSDQLSQQRLEALEQEGGDVQSFQTPK
ncbi:MAG TPA: tetratricopeptide repeat protein [Terriglobia bacterium]